MLVLVTWKRGFMKVINLLRGLGECGAEGRLDVTGSWSKKNYHVLNN